MAVGLSLYLLISGDVLYLGLSVLALGVLAAGWRPRLGRAAVCGGLALALMSAVPVHPGAYALLFVAVVAWLSSRDTAAVMRRATTITLVGTLAAIGLDGVVFKTGTRLVSARLPVYVLGDSLSAGLGVSPDHMWPQILAAQRSLDVSNLARPGATLADGLAQARAIPHGPATVLVELGGNDVLAGTAPARFDSDLRVLLTAVVAQDRQVFMFELPLLPFQNSFGRIQREACKNHGVALLPRSILAGAVALPGNASDGLHLTPRGNTWLAGRMSALWAR